MLAIGKANKEASKQLKAQFKKRTWNKVVTATTKNCTPCQTKAIDAGLSKI